MCNGLRPSSCAGGSLVTTTLLILKQVVAQRNQQEVILRTLLDPQSPRGADGNVVEVEGNRPTRA
jgi:hypothetical protein